MAAGVTDACKDGRHTAALARFAVDSQWVDIPKAVVREALRSILNFAGCAIGGSRSEAVNRSLRVFDRFSGPRKASVFGRAEKLDLFAAACLNAMSANVLTYDDTHVPTPKVSLRTAPRRQASPGGAVRRAR